ncbi:MAG: hypothetical protein K1X47_04910 [Cyclobacteriaceae bacterium]|nr:hypothetical protein [Cyclobacteriaceae bacterium]
MSEDEKRVRLLLKAVIYHYHGLDELESKDLEKTATDLKAHEAFEWAMEFVRRDYLTAFERAREFLNEVIGDYPREKRVDLISMAWDCNNLKGYITEMEATAILKLAKDWKVEQEFVEIALR